MQYYIMMEKRTDELQILLRGCPDIVEQGTEFDLGEKIEGKFAKIIHEYESGPYHYYLGDSVVAAGFKGLLLNKKTLDLLKSLGVNNIQHLEVELRDPT